MSEITISLDNIDPVEFLGVNNSKLEILKDAYPKVKVTSRGNKITISGNINDIEQFQEKSNQMIFLIEKNGKITENHLNALLKGIPPYDVDIPDISDDVLVHGPNGITVRAKTVNQKRMVTEVNVNDILFSIGPAGTGKTYTAVALAVRALKSKQVKKIILTRPAVEAGENLGFLPGDLKEKIDPYLRPLYDALDDMIPMDKLNYYMQNRVIEVAPLAFMRGRTLDNAFIILDEAQNTSDLQLKMLLTRIGPSAKLIVTGDLTQIDLPKYQRSGLFKALDILANIKGISIVYLDEGDVIRHKLVKAIISAYDKSDKESPNE